MASTDNNPWTILDQRVTYDNPWIRVDEYQVRQPRGGHGIYGVVHFKNKAIGIVALDEAGCIYLVGQYRFPLGRYSWEIPEGGGPEGEDPLETAQRELLEETGLVAEHWEVLLQMDVSNSVSDETCVVYLARGLSQHKAHPEDTEVLAIKKLPFETALAQTLKGEITDSITVAALLKLGHQMNENKTK